MALSPHDIKGTIHVEADDGTGTKGETKDKGPQNVPVDESVTDGPSSAKGHVGNWNSVKGTAKASAGRGAARTAKAKSQNTVSADLEAKLPENVTLNFEATIEATLTGDGKATVTITAEIPNTNAKVTKEYKLEVAKDPTKINIGNGQPGQMKNGGKSTQKATDAKVNLPKGKYALAENVNVESEADADVSVTVEFKDEK